MRTDELIVELARRGDAVTPLPSPAIRFLRWALAASLLLAIAIVIREPRADLAAALLRPSYLAEATLTLGTALAAGAMALAMSVPGRVASPMLRWGPWMLAAAWMALLGVEFASAGTAWSALVHEPVLASCVKKTVTFGLPAGLLLLWLIRRAAPLDPAWTTGLAALGALAIGAIGTQVDCPIDRPGHLMTAHAAPVVLLAVVAAVAGPWLIRVGMLRGPETMSRGGDR